MTMLQFLFGLLLILTAVFLILLVLVQRGRGGGLAGALGGMGGQSAFGAKAGDTFTKITIWAATFWILLCMATVVVLNRPERKLNPGGEAIGAYGTSTTEEGEETVPAGETEGSATEGAATSGAASDAGASSESSESGSENP
jgi:preprotein translocase subunit SecG